MSSPDLSGASAVEAIANLARAAVGDERIVRGEDGRCYALLPQASGGVVLHEIGNEGRAPALRPHIEQLVSVDSKQSLVDYVNAFKGSTSRLFARLSEGAQASTITAVLDYHRPADSAVAEAGGSPVGRAQHVVVYTLRDSEEWARWSSISFDTPRMSQHEFVRFLEENAADIESPQGADILELARDFSAKKKVNFSSAIRTQSGDVSFEYTAEAEARSKSGAIEVPNLFRLKIPVFYGEPPMQVLAYLRYSIDDGLRLGIQLHRPVFIRQSLFELIGQDVAGAVGLPLHYGSYSKKS